jgi:hypothetical protein
MQIRKNAVLKSNHTTFYFQFVNSIMKKILTIIATFSLCIQLNAQKYRTAVGARIGTRFGISVQQKVFEQSTIEGIFQTNVGNKDDIMLTFLWEQHQKLIGKRLNFYYGGGIHKGWIVNKSAKFDLKNPSGVSLIAGVEITFDRLNVSLDYKPLLNVISGEQFYESQSALTLRYVFIKSKKKKKKDWKFWKKDKN